MPLSKTHKKKIAAGVRAYHARAKSCLAKEKAARSVGGAAAASKPTKKRVKPVLVQPLKAQSKPKRRVKPTIVGGTAGQQTTNRLLNNLSDRVGRLKGKDFSPSLAF